MGEYADAVIYGDCCPCGEYLGDGPGFPQYCSSQCARDYGDHDVSPVSAKRPEFACPYCKKVLKTAQGVDDHVRAKHSDIVGTDRPESVREASS